LNADDDEDFISRAFPLRSPRNQTKYDTFLDLSNLELDDENPNDHNSNGIAFDSDSEAEDRKWSWEIEERFRGESSSYDLHNSMYNDFGEELSQNSARGPLEKIDEHPSEADCDDVDGGSRLNRIESSTSEATTDLDVCDLTTSDCATDATSQSNMEETATTTSTNSYTTQTLSSDAEMQSNCEDNVDIYEHQKTTADDLSNSSSSNSTENTNSAIASEASDTCRASIKTSDSLESLESDSSEQSQEYNLDEAELYKTYPVSDKTASLDRYSFRRPIKQRTIVKSQVEDIQETVHSAINPKPTLHAVEKTNVYMGLNRFYHIVLSTINGNAKTDVKIKDILDFIEVKGIRRSDPRLRVTMKRIEDEPMGMDTPLNVEVFSR